MADKLTQLIVEALTRAAADPAGSPLYAGKAEPGLFPATAVAKPAAKKAADDGLLRLVRTESKGKGSRELYAATEAGVQFLLTQSNPKQVLEDFVRVLEERETQVSDLLTTVRGMADSLAGMRAVAGMVLPQVAVARVSTAGAAPVRAGPPHTARSGGPIMNGIATLATPLTAPMAVPSAAVCDADDLPDAVMARLTDWAASAAAGQDCPLPDLYPQPDLSG